MVEQGKTKYKYTLICIYTQEIPVNRLRTVRKSGPEKKPRGQGPRISAAEMRGTYRTNLQSLSSHSDI